ncbi:MAG: ribosomal protein S18-alanine N-acetyltransferase [Myxococcota bacterium]
MSGLDWLRATGRRGPVAYRAATLEDFERILVIERAAHPYPWTSGMLRDEFSVEHGVVRLGLVDGEVVGYVVAWVVLDEVHVQNVAVHPGWQRCGVATALLESLFGQGVAHGVARALLEVRSSNSAAIELYEAVGFEVLGRRSSYYADDGQDAVVMSYSLSLPEG